MSKQTPISRYFRLEPANGVTVVHFVDIQISPDSKDLLYSLVENEGHRKLLLDFSNISALSTHGLGILATLQKKLQALGGSMRLSGLDDDILKLFHMTKFDRIFQIHENRQAALDSFD
jgi:anti-anti-sigma factor